MSERVLVTGAAGFIGSHCCSALLGSGLAVVGIDNFDPFYDRTIKEEGLRDLHDHERFAFVEGDIRDDEAVRTTLKDVDVVLHLAARAGVRPSIQDPGLFASINVEGTARLLETCRQSGVRRFVFGSSSSVYGDTTPVPFREDAPALDPISPYAATKRAAELLCRVHTHLYGARIAALRLFTVYGARQRPDLAIHRFTQLLANGLPIQQFGDGSSERDYTHVDDIVSGILAAVRWTEPDDPTYEVFNLGESRTVRLDYLIELIASILGVQPGIEISPRQPGDVEKTCADITKAGQILGYDPRVAIEDGIARFVDWYREAHGHELSTPG